MKEYIARVVSLDDPKEYQRARVRVYEKFPEELVDDSELPWATYKLPVGAGLNEGLFVPAKVGDEVWVDFPFVDHDGREDTRKPRITGSVHVSPDGLSTMPHDAFGGPLSLDDLHQVPEVDDGSGGKEVDPDYEETKDSELGRAAVFTKEGLTFRVQNGAFTATHRKTGARLEFSESGHFDIFTPQNGFVRAVNKLKLWGGEIAVKAAKLFSLDIPALEQKVKDWSLEADNVKILSTGGVRITAKALQAATDGDMIFSGGGKRESSFSGSDLSKVGRLMVAPPGKAWGADLHIEGIPLAEVTLDNEGGFKAANNLAELLMDSDGLFKVSNQTADLKGDVLLVALDSSALGALSSFLQGYAAHTHADPASGTTGPPSDATAAGTAKAAMDTSKTSMDGNFSKTVWYATAV